MEGKGKEGMSFIRPISPNSQRKGENPNVPFHLDLIKMGKTKKIAKIAL